MSLRDNRNAVTEDDAGLLRVYRRVRCRRSIMIARQKIQVGIGHSGRTVAVEEADTTFRVYDGAQLLTEVLRSPA